MPSLIDSSRLRRPLATMQQQVGEYLRARGGVLRFSFRCEDELNPQTAPLLVFIESWDIQIGHRPDDQKRIALLVEYLPALGEILLYTGQEWDGGPDLKAQLDSLVQLKEKFV